MLYSKTSFNSNNIYRFYQMSANIMECFNLKSMYLSIIIFNCVYCINVNNLTYIIVLLF